MQQIYLRISFTISTYPHCQGIESPFIQQIPLNCYRGPFQIDLSDSEKILTLFWFTINKFKCQICEYIAVFIGSYDVAQKNSLK